MLNFEVEIERSRRRSVVITVKEGKVICKAPKYLSDERINAFLTQKKGWIEKKLHEQEKESKKFCAVKMYRTILDGGTERPVWFGLEKEGEEKNGFYFPSPEHIRRYFERTRKQSILYILEGYLAEMGRSPTKVGFRDFKSRWGSCDASGKILLNWRLTMLPERLAEYVVIHELSHLRFMDHSAAFWKEVERFCPDYRSRRKELKEYSFLTLYYRREAKSESPIRKR